MFKQVVSVAELEDEVRNAGEETQVVVGFLKCFQRNWFRYLHDYHYNYMLNQMENGNVIYGQSMPIFLMIDIEHCEETILEDYGISSRTTPTVVFVRNTQKLAKLELLQPLYALLERIEEENQLLFFEQKYQ